MAEEEKKKRKKKKKKKVKPPTLWQRIQQINVGLGMAAAILGSLLYFYGFVSLDTEKFKQTDITVVSQQGLLFIEWDLGDIPTAPTEIIYYVDGIQFANEIYPTGLREAVGFRTRYISSYTLPPVTYLNPQLEHDFKAVVVFNGWSTLFVPKPITFSTTFTQRTDNETNNNSGFRPFNDSFSGRQWTVEIPNRTASFS